MEDTIESASENQNAGQKPSTLNPCTNLLSSIMIPVLMTSRNKPNVRIVIGSVRMTRIGLIKKFSRPSTIATTIAVQ